MKFFSTTQIKNLDQFTIEHEPIKSIDLMERAADALYHEVLNELDYNQAIYILAGPGNNGGDALALARMLLQTSLNVNVILVHTGKLAPDCYQNSKRLIENFPGVLIEQTEVFVAPSIEPCSIIIDGLFGSGLTRKLDGIFADAVNWMNSNENKVISIDIPSGLHGEENSDLTLPIVRADITLSLQFPKLAFFFAENERFVGSWKVVEIGIHPTAIELNRSNLFVLDKKSISALIKQRSKFAHKGTFGRAYILAGSMGMSGASVLACKAAMRTGAGLVTIHGPEENRVIVQSSVPEVIYQSDVHPFYITNYQDIDNFNAYAVGPGVGLHVETALMLKRFLLEIKHPCVIDADALNIIGDDRDLLDVVPANSIFTPHPKEFERIFGASRSSFDRLMKAQEAAQRYKIIIVLKGANTVIALPDARLYFNTTGNQGMATAGAGDVLTGMIVALLAQGYSSENAAKVAVYLHGLAGDFAIGKQSMESLIASDIIDNIGVAYLSLSATKSLNDDGGVS